MKIGSNDLIGGFVKDFCDGSDYRERDVEALVDLLWGFIRFNIESGELGSIRIPGFGVFKVFEGRVRFMLYVLEGRFQRGNVSEAEYLSERRVFDSFLERIESDPRWKAKAKRYEFKRGRNHIDKVVSDRNFKKDEL